ncbi:hypothetical protein M422DRAFT_27258 [Sphaerobolus stellatus SS14]|nr:hypothetical protein M422DRAFT_27258 [Sphaerobolus stellatus SS14]
MASYNSDDAEPMPHGQYTAQEFYNQGADPSGQHPRVNNSYTQMQPQFQQRQPQSQGESYTDQATYTSQAYPGQVSLPGPSSSRGDTYDIKGHHLRYLTQEEKHREQSQGQRKEAACTTCGIYFVSMYNAGRHAKKTEKQYSCEHCGKVYARKDYRDTHVAERKCSESRRALGHWQANEYQTGNWQ